MQTLSFVIGGTAAGKTYFIRHFFEDKDVEKSDIYDFQQLAYEEAGYGKFAPIPVHAQFSCLLKAQNMHMQDIVQKLKEGKSVVAEQTFFKAKRRITYIDEVRNNIPDVKIEVYVILPDDERWEANCKARGTVSFKESKSLMENNFEFPNPAEGFDAIFEVKGEDIRLRMDPEKPEILTQVMKELEEEKNRIREEEEKKRKRKELLESMNTRPFWHYCEVCGKKDYMTADEAHEAGWDYPPKIGIFGLLGPRTCGNCLLKDTLYAKINAPGRIPIVLESQLNEKELITWRRIKKEPESLLEEEV